MEKCCALDGEGKKKPVPRAEKEQKALVTRLNRIEGQIRGIRNMIEEDRYCVDVLTQVRSVQSALNAFNRELLSGHIRSCVAEDIRAGNENAIEELCELLKNTMKS